MAANNDKTGRRFRKQRSRDSLPLSKKVALFLGENAWIITASEAAYLCLSVASVACYIAGTYNVDTRTADIGLSACFFAEWLCFFWLAPSKFLYLVSPRRLIDLVTVLPAFSALVSSDKEHLVAIYSLRVLRLLSLNRALRISNNLRAEIHQRVLGMAITMALILIGGSGLFYESEKAAWHERFLAGDESYDLNFHNCLYFVAITITTVGYGDISPKTYEGRIITMCMLILLFTAIPYQSSKLLEAMMNSNSYMRNRYSPFWSGEHVVVTGFLTEGSVKHFLSEFYHAGHGYTDVNVVFMGAEMPNRGIREALANGKYSNSHRLVYLQGSVMNPADLARAAVPKAKAVFILADKMSFRPQLDDSKTIIYLLAVGHAIQAYIKRRNTSSLLLRRVRLWVKRWFLCRGGAGSGGSTAAAAADADSDELLTYVHPRLFVQLQLASSKNRLFQLLRGFVGDQFGWGAGEDGGSGGGVSSGDGGGGDSSGILSGRYGRRSTGDRIALNPKRSRSGGSGPLSSRLSSIRLPGTWSGAAPAAAGGGGGGKHKQHSAGPGDKQPRRPRGSVDYLPEAAPTHAPTDIPGVLTTEYWTVFCTQLSVISMDEFSQSLMAHSCLACPGLVTLVTNLFTNGTSTISRQLGKDGVDVPAWFKQYEDGASKEVYSVEHLPRCFAGQTFGRVARFVHERYGATLLALDLPEAQTPVAALLVAPVTEVIEADMGGLIIADDSDIVFRISATRDADFNAWCAANPAEDDDWHSNNSAGSTATAARCSSAEPPAAKYAAAHATAAVLTPARVDVAATAAGSAAAATAAVKSSDAAAKAVAAAATTAAVDIVPKPRPLALPTTSTLGSNASAGSLYSMPSHLPLLRTISSIGSSGDVLFGGGGGGGSANFSLNRIQRRMVSFMAVSKEIVHPKHVLHMGSKIDKREVDAWMGANYHTVRRWWPRGSASGVASPAAVSPRSLGGSSVAAPAAVPRSSNYGDGSGGGGGGGDIRSLVVDDVDRRGHVVICGVDDPDSLFSMILPFRSTRLPSIVDIVVLLSEEPSGPAWSEVARLTRLEIVVGSLLDPEDMRRVDAATAAHVLITRGANRAGGDDSSDDDDDDDDMGRTFLADAETMFAMQKVVENNPEVRVTVELVVPESAALLQPALNSAEDDADGVLLSPPFLAGDFMLSTIADSMFVQSFHAESSELLLSKLLNQWHTEVRLEALMQRCESQAAPPAVGSPRPAALLPSHPLPTADSEPAVPYDANGSAMAAASPRAEPAPRSPASPFQTAACGRSAVPYSRLRACPIILQVPVDSLVYGTFGELFNGLLTQRQMVAVALYRTVHHRGEKMRHVVTAPPRGLKLDQDDWAMVMCDLQYSGGMVPQEAYSVASTAGTVMQSPQ